MPQPIDTKRLFTEFSIVTLAGVMLGYLGLTRLGSTWIDVLAVMTALWYVHLAAREQVWCFPIGAVSAVLTGIAFSLSALPGDAGLQGVYFLFMIYGWRQWGSPAATQPVTVRRAMPWEWAVGLAFIAFGTIGGYFWFQTIAGKAPFWDALTTSISLVAQWFQTRKVIENWPFWIVVNLVYVPLYLTQGLAIYAPLYGVFLILAVFGWSQWWTSLKTSSASV